jgi:hypothetical protein
MGLINDLYQTSIGGLVGLTLIVGCEHNSGSDYTRRVGLPKDCKTIISAGSSVSGDNAGTINVDWVSCFDYSCNLVIYRMPKSEDKWYSTIIFPHNNYRCQDNRPE